MSLTLCCAMACTFLTLGEDDTTARGSPRQDKVWTILRQARLLCWAGRHAEAEAVFRRRAQDVRLPYAANGEARFCQAETFRLQGRSFGAAGAYRRLLREFPFGPHLPQAREHLFDIANTWLDDTRAEMEQPPGRPLRKGTLSRKEARAVRALWDVFFTDPTGPLAAKACFFMGSVCFFREDYAEAARHYTNLVEYNPKHALAPKAVEQAITATLLSIPEGADDGGRLAEARRLLKRFRENYPAAAAERQESLTRQSHYLTCLEAERGLETARRLEQAGWMSLAWPVYGSISTHYPGTPAARAAQRRLEVLRTRSTQNR